MNSRRFGLIMPSGVRGILWGGALFLAAIRTQAASPFEAPWRKVFSGNLEGRDGFIYASASDRTVPALGDVDGDGDLDLVIGQIDNWPLFCRNDGTRKRAVWTLVESVMNLDSTERPVHTAPALADMNGDGHPELLVGMGDGAVAYFEFAAEGGASPWVLVNRAWIPAPPLRKNARPAPADLDGDGDLDLVVGYDNGTMARFENPGGVGAPEMIPITELFQGIKLTGQASPTFADINGDGDTDLFVGDGQGYINVFDNDPRFEGDVFLVNRGRLRGIIQRGDVLTTPIKVSANMAPAFADLNDDGSLDLVTGGLNGPLRIYRNLGSVEKAVWAPPRPLMGALDVGLNSIPELADIDGDGDLDLFLSGQNSEVAGEWGIQFFRNEGSRWEPNWKMVTLQFQNLAIQNAAPRLVDMDGDGDLDLMVGDLTGTIRAFRNEGTPQVWDFVEAPGWSLEAGGWLAIPWLADMDGDGDYDMWVCAYDSLALRPMVRYFRNVGNSETPDFLASPEDWTQRLTVGDFQGLTIGDVDGDGILDLIIASDTGIVQLHRGAPVETGFDFDPPIPMPWIHPELFTVPVLADVDGNAYPDLFLGGAYGGLRYYQNPMAPLTLLPPLRTVVAGEVIPFNTSPTVQGEWRVVHNPSGGFFDEGLPPGRYVAGETEGSDVVRFTATDGRMGTAFINVIASDQGARTGKAIVVAGAKENDSLWPTTRQLADNIVEMLRYRGFSEEAILYLRAHDVSGAGVDGVSTLENIQAAVTQWASDVDQVFLYFLDHGGKEEQAFSFQANGAETLEAATLDAWLDALQGAADIQVTVAIDSCQSGGFLPVLANEGEPARVVIASASESQPAFFSAGGLISFTTPFTAQLQLGHTVLEAFESASAAIGAYQTPQLDDDGDGVWTAADGARADAVIVGLEELTGHASPQIGDVSVTSLLDTPTSSPLIWAQDITASLPIQRVWAHIAVPDFIPQTRQTPDSPVQTIPEWELLWNEARQRFEAPTPQSVQRFGISIVNIYAMDTAGRVSAPKTVNLLQRASARRLIVVTGQRPYDESTDWADQDAVANSVYQIARARWMSDSDIEYLSASTDTAVDAAPTKANLLAAVTAAPADEEVLTIFMIGGMTAEGAFDIDGSGASDQILTAEALDVALDALQTANPSLRVEVIIEAAQAGQWTQALRPPGEAMRVVITSAAPGETAFLRGSGQICFAQYFFYRLLGGDHYHDAFIWARSAIRAVTGEAQNPRLDDNGDGVGAKSDGSLAQTIWLGAPSVAPPSGPVIQVAPSRVLLTTPSATLWVSGVRASDGIRRVYALMAPQNDTVLVTDTLQLIRLEYSDERLRWQAVVEPIDPDRDYRVQFYAVDRLGRRSEPRLAHYGPATPDTGDDRYDRFMADDTVDTRNFVSNDNATQNHNLYAAGDEDWIVFNIDPGLLYSVTVTAQESRCDARIELYHESDTATPLVTRDDAWAGEDELISWDSGTRSGRVFVRIDQSPDAQGASGPETGYRLTVTSDWGDNAGLASISPTGFGRIDSTGGGLSVGPQGIYTQHLLSVPAGALSAPVEILMDSTGDVGANPYYPYTQAWLAAHPNNASILQLMTESAVPLSVPAQITVEFVDDDHTYPSFPIDDLPDGVSPSQMRIHRWTGSEWEILPGPQNVVGQTVSGTIEALGELGHEDGYAISLFAVAPVESPTTPSPTPSPTPSISPTPAPTPTPPTPAPDGDRDGKPDDCESGDVAIINLGVATNIQLADSDGDGLLDGQEAPGECAVTTDTLAQTNPRDGDSDGDGFGDGMEVLVMGTNPLSPADPDPANPAFADQDQDGVPAYMDPDDSTIDSDQDGYRDDYEIIQGADPDDADNFPMLGDVNDNGLTNNVDAIMLFNYTLGNIPAPTALERGDTLVNGLINNVDAIFLFNWTLGNVEVLPG